MSSNNKDDAGGGGADVAPGDFSIAAMPTTLSIPIASQATVTVTVVPNGVGDITLSAQGLGTNLEVTFDPAVIPAGETTSTATIRVKGGTAAGTSTVMLTGTAGAVTHSANVDVTSTTITVSGTVRGGRPGVTVGLVGKGSVTSGAGGVFTFSDVTPPYDLYTVIDSGCSTSANNAITSVYYFDDLTRTDPVVTADSAFVLVGNVLQCGGIAVLCSSKTAAITSARSGTGNGTDHIVADWGADRGSYTLGNFNASSISGTAGWCTTASSTGMLYALQFTRKASLAPDTYLGYARSSSATLNDATPTNVALNFQAVGSTATLTGTLAGPAGYPAPTIQLRQEFGPVSTELWETTTTTTVDATIPLIQTAGGTNLYARATMGSATSSYVYPLTQNTTVNYTMPTPAVLTAPAAAASGVTTATAFTWTPAAGTISEVLISGSLRRYRIFTTGSQLTIPVLTEAMLPAGGSFSWSVQGYGPYTNVNDAAASNELETVSPTDFQGPEHAYTTSGSRTFTTP